MALEIRPIRDDEVEAAEAITAYAFNDQDRFDLTRRVQQARQFYSTEWSLAAFEDGEMTTFMRTIPFAMRINGRALPFGAVGPVAASPLHRRKGHTGAILRESLRLMRERGQVLSGLCTPHPAFYRRYGWEVAAEARLYRLKPKDLRLTQQPSETGRFERVTPDEWPRLDAVYRQYSSRRNGPLHRGPVWWPNAVLGASAPRPLDAVLWLDGDGEPRGYVVFDQPSPPARDAGKVMVRELIAADADARLNLLLYLGRHDIAEQVVIRTSGEEPLLNLLEDTDRVSVGQEYTVLLRVVDFERAAALRPVVEGTEDLEFRIEVRDETAHWNEGTWRVYHAEGKTGADKVEGAADISITARGLAPVFNGYIRMSTAIASGLARSTDEAAVRAADRFFAAEHAPYFPDRF